MKTGSLFQIRREERWIALSALLLLTALNALVILKYVDLFTPLQDNYWNLFIGRFHVSGFDPITYYVVSDWEARYNVYRHPLLSFLMWVPYVVNQGCMALFGINCVQFIVALMPSSPPSMPSFSCTGYAGTSSGWAASTLPCSVSSSILSPS